MQKRKPSVFSKAFKFIILLAVGLLLTFSLFSYGIPKSIVFIIIIAFYVAFSMLLAAVYYLQVKITWCHRPIRRQ